MITNDDELKPTRAVGNPGRRGEPKAAADNKRIDSKGSTGECQAERVCDGADEEPTSGGWELPELNEAGGRDWLRLAGLRGAAPRERDRRRYEAESKRLTGAVVGNGCEHRFYLHPPSW